jgi:hypothetical protein
MSLPPRQATAVAAVYLAAKLEECPRRARDVINVAHYLAATRQGVPYEPMDLYGPVRPCDRRSATPTPPPSHACAHSVTQRAAL